MADFASYKESKDTVPFVINLDIVETIFSEDDLENNTFKIVFAKLPTKGAEEEGKIKTWYQNIAISKPVMIWEFTSESFGSSYVAQEARDQILGGLISGVRQFEGNSWTSQN